MNTPQHRRSNDHGFSLIEVLVGLALVGVAATVLLTSTDILQQQMRFSKTMPAATRYASQLAAGAASMLLDSTAQGGVEQGICGLVSTDAAAPGVGNIRIALAPYSGKSRYAFTEARWRAKFAGWTPTDAQPAAGCPYSDNWRKCFKLNVSNRAELSDKGLSMLDVIGSIQIIPTYTNPNKGLFKRINIGDGLTDVDVKDVGFSIVAEVSYKTSPNATKRRTKKLTDFVWAPSVGLCKGTIYPKRSVLLSLSGMGASNPDGNTVYNRSYFTGDLDAPLIVDFRKTQIQEGKLADNGQAITTDTSKNISVSCNERRYHCPLLSSSQRVYGPMDVTMDIEYNPHNTLSKFAASMNLQPNFSISRSGSEAIGGASSVKFTLDGADGGNFRVSGSHQLAAEISDKGAATNSNNVCRAVCIERTNYNKGGDTSASRYRPSLKYSFQEFPKNSFTAASDEEVGCTACYMKNCAQIGLGTFGPMDKQPDQPLDSNIPECWLTEPAAPNRRPYADAATFTVENLADGDQTCIAGHLDQNSNKLVLRPRSCSSKMPVLCYGFGGFVLPRDVNGTNWTLVRAGHAEAAQSCYQMGKETANGESLGAILEGNDAANLPSANGEVSFVNLAQQGMFLAPQLPKDLTNLRKWMTKYGVDEEFWVALNYAGGQVVAMAPTVNNAFGNDNLALYYNTLGRMRLTRYGLDLAAYTKPGTPDAATSRLLFHHIKYKGEIGANRSQSRSLRYLCIGSNSRVFASNQRGREPDQGNAICQAEHGQYLRPQTPREWIEALNQVKPLMELLPYPDLDITIAEALDPVWVSTDYSPPTAN